VSMDRALSSTDRKHALIFSLWHPFALAFGCILKNISEIIAMFYGFGEGLSLTSSSHKARNLFSQRNRHRVILLLSMKRYAARRAQIAQILDLI
jgi:hypothetical protein